jgi:predicted nucleotidyltransferase
MHPARNREANCETVHETALHDVLNLKPDRSDIDFLVDFGPMPPFDKPDAYFGLLDELHTILGTEVDLVMVGALKNRYIRDDVNWTKQQLYAE